MVVFVAFTLKYGTLTATMTHTHNVNWKDAFQVEELENAQVKITGELPFAELQSERTAAVTALGKDVELDGFRKGHIPTPILEKHLGEMTILGEMAERAIAHSYPHILEAHDIDAIGHPQIEVTKIAPDNPLAFTATVAIVPTFDLPKYEQIAKDINKNRPADEVEDGELADKITEIQKQKRAYDRMQELATAEADAPADEEGKKQSMDDIRKKVEEEQDAPLPELTDEYVKTLGQPGQFETVDDFKTKLREHIEIEKVRDNAAKHRANITDAIIEKTDITLPQVLIDSELAQMWAQMTDDIARNDLKMDDYLAHIKKTKEELMKEWQPAAEKRAKLQLILNEIARKRELKPDPEEVETQAKALMEQFKDADKHRVTLYVASMVLNEMVMKELEEMK